jgi:carboxyl-terminal processing protease
MTMTSLDQFVLDAALRSAVVLAIAWCVSLVLLAWGRCSAALRHRLWTLALAGTLAVPLLMGILPALKVSLPSLSPVPFDATRMEFNADADMLAFSRADESPLSHSHPTIALATPNETVFQIAAIEKEASPTTTPVSWLFVIWSIGACLALVPTCAGIVSLWRLSRRSTVVSTGWLVQTLRQSIVQVGVRRPVRLLVSDDRSMPMTWGIFQPTILLPAAAAGWSHDRLQMVLLHELAHIERRDCLAQIVAQVARAAHWFNPLAWLAERNLRFEQEQACDDFVISRGIEAPDYAGHLLAVAAACVPGCRSALALAMAQSSKLEGRLRVILNARHNRAPLAWRPALLTAALAIGLTATLSALHLERSVASDSQAQAQKTPDNPGVAIQGTDQAKTLAELRSKISEQYVKPVNENEMLQGAIKGMIQSLRDPYSDYLTPEMLAQIEKQIGGSLVGIGAQLETHDKQIRVVTPLPGSPALQAGIQPGDLILEIDGQPAGMELNEAVKRIVGADGSTVRLTIGRGANEKLPISVTRGPIKLSSIKAFRASADNQPGFLLDAANKIGYVQVEHFGSSAPQEMTAAIESLQAGGLKGLILDLRSCPGGTLDAAVGMAKLFHSSGTIVSIHRPAKTTELKAEAQAVAGEFPMIVLVNGQTASAAEVFVGALKDNQRALVLGTRTLGKGSIQTLIKLNDGSGAIKLTTSEYRLPSGRSIDKRPGEKSWGIDPDEGFFVPLDHKQAKAMRERRHERQVIGGKAAADGGRNTPVTAASLEAQESDPQLAAALKALTARQQSGAFAKISNISAAQAEQMVQRAEIEQRRETALEALKKIDDELAQLGPAQPARN